MRCRVDRGVQGGGPTNPTPYEDTEPKRRMIKSELSKTLHVAFMKINPLVHFLSVLAVKKGKLDGPQGEL